jgi:sulfonate transport system substrate-binding protein
MSPSRSRIVGVLVTVGLALAGLASCGNDDEGSSGATPPTEAVPTTSAGEDDGSEDSIDLSGVTLRIGVLATTGSVRQTLYERSGAYVDVPYEIEWIDFETSVQAVEALNAGAIDLAAVMNSTVAVLAQGNASSPWTTESAPLRIVHAMTAVDDPGFLLVVRGGSGVEDLESLAGARVAYARGAYGHYFLARTLRDVGLEMDAIEAIELPAGEARAAFLSGSVDAVVTTYRNALPLLETEGASVLATASDVVVQYNVSLARAGLFDDPAREAAVADLLERISASELWGLEHVDEVAQIYESEAGLDRDLALAAAAAAPRRRVPLDDTVVAALQEEADVFLAEGVLRSQVDVSVIVDRRFEGAG